MLKIVKVEIRIFGQKPTKPIEMLNTLLALTLMIQSNEMPLSLKLFLLVIIAMAMILRAEVTVVKYLIFFSKS